MRINWVLVIILVVALFVRVYRVDQLLGFYFDQGRDGLVIWDLWHKGKLFLIGPTTGIEGIFLGPFYYYFISPAYLLGNGDPIWPAVWVAITNVAGIGLIYLMGKRYFDTATGLLAAGFVTLSYKLILVDRWLANPAPLPFFALGVAWALLEIVHGRGKWWNWAGLGLGIGLSLQFEAASATFFLPATGLILQLFRHSIKWRWQLVTVAGIAFLATLMPQLIFDLRHQHLLLHTFEKFLVAEKSFHPEISSRLSFYFETFVNKFVPNLQVGKYFAIAVAILAAVNIKRLTSKSSLVLLIWWLTPVVGLLFYHGNNGYVWDYYFTGVYPSVILLVAGVLAAAWKRNFLAKLVVLVLLVLFLQHNLALIKSTLGAGIDGPQYISMGNSLWAVDWVYQDAGNRQFNVDVYVPPVIPYAYNYLFLWQGETKYHHKPSTENRTLLYTIYEADPPHPERLQAWMDRQVGIGEVEEETTFGGVTVQRRHRI